MGLFSRKKKEDKILPLPEFPKLPNEPNFPFYDEQVDEKPTMMPKQESRSDFKKIIPTESFSFEKDFNSMSFEKPNMDFEELPKSRSSFSFEKRDDKPLFVKIDKYKESLKTVEIIKSKLNEAEDVLKRLERLRDDENRELQEWQSSLSEIRQKLLKVDKDLFEL